MKNQKYIPYSAIQEIGLLVINALGTYFKNTLVNHLKTYFFRATAFFPAGAAALAAACC